MLSDLFFLFSGVTLGMCGMKMIVDYKDKHVYLERAKTERYRSRCEQLNVTLASITTNANPAVATANTDSFAPMPMDVFTDDDKAALGQGKRVVRMQGGARA